MDVSPQQTCQQDRWFKLPLGFKKPLKWPSHGLLVDRCYFMTECSKLPEVLACGWRPCFLKVLIQKPNICDTSKEVCGKVGTSPPWQAGPVLCFSIVRRMTEKMLFKRAWGMTFLAVMATDCYRKGSAPSRELGFLFFEEGRIHSAALYGPGCVSHSVHGSHSNSPVSLFIM